MYLVLCIYVSVYLCICVSVYLCICVSVYLCICVSVYLCICVSTIYEVQLIKIIIKETRPVINTIGRIPNLPELEIKPWSTYLTLLYLGTRTSSSPLFKLPVPPPSSSTYTSL